MRPAHPDYLPRYGPWALVTGASDGIGRAFCEALAAAGFNLLMVARRRALLDALAARLGAEHGHRCMVVDADLARPGAVERVIAAAAQLDVGLVVCAAGFGSSGPAAGSDARAALEMVEVNCKAVLALTLAFAPRLQSRGRGGIVLMSSLLAFQGTPRAANYAATKAYVQALGEGLRSELAESGVDIVVAAPGPVRSGFAGRADMRMGLAAPPEVVAAGALRALPRGGTIRPGWLSKALELSLAALPRVLRVRAIGVVMAGMTAHHPR